MKTLYLTDLDGTIFKPDVTLTPFTVEAINRFIAKGGLFTYATARSRVSSSQITAPLDINLPVICYNGAFTYDANGGIITSHIFMPEKKESIRKTLEKHGVSPIIFGYVNGEEKFSYIREEHNPGKAFHLTTRPGDRRHREVYNHNDLYQGDAFYFVGIGTEKELSPLREIFENDETVQCVYQRDLYYDAIWCEILPAKANKAIAAQELKRILGCDKLVVFGDGINDRSMFLAADECYAVANAVPELTAIATAVIGANTEDGVARFLYEID
jgi:Cof subfamily protein (haloacid dehalogenase superfamily)